MVYQKEFTGYLLGTGTWGWAQMEIFLTYRVIVDEQYWFK